MDKWVYADYLKRKFPELYKGKTQLEVAPFAEDHITELKSLPVYERYDDFDELVISTTQLQMFFNYIEYLEGLLKFENVVSDMPISIEDFLGENYGPTDDDDE